MGIHAIHHRRRPALSMPINTSDDYCRAGCWTPPGREHGLACPAVEPHHNLRFFRGLLIGLALVFALYGVASAATLLIWSLT